MLFRKAVIVVDAAVYAGKVCFSVYGGAHGVLSMAAFLIGLML